MILFLSDCVGTITLVYDFHCKFISLFYGHLVRCGFSERLSKGGALHVDLSKSL